MSRQQADMMEESFNLYFVTLDGKRNTHRVMLGYQIACLQFQLLMGDVARGHYSSATMINQRSLAVQAQIFALHVSPQQKAIEDSRIYG